MTQNTGTENRKRSGLLLTLALGAALAGMVALAGPAEKAEAAFTTKIVFVSERTTGVNNPTGDSEIFKMNPDGSGVKQLTFNKVNDVGPVLSPDGKKIAYTSYGVQTSNPEGDGEVYRMDALDGTGKINLSNNGSGVEDHLPVFSPDSTRIAYESHGKQTSNPEGDWEVYRVNVLDGSGKKNLSNNGVEVSGAYAVDDYTPDFSPDGKKIAYESYGVQTSNPMGGDEVYVMNAADGSGKKNLSNNDATVVDYDPVFSPDGKKIAYTSYGVQTSNPEGDGEVYVMNSLDGTDQTNLTNSGGDAIDDAPAFSPDGKKVAYQSSGVQTSNLEGDSEIYIMNSLDGSRQTNLTSNGRGVTDFAYDFSLDGTKIAYTTYGVQTSNSQGDAEVYRMSASDGTGKENLTHNNALDGYPYWGR